MTHVVDFVRAEEAEVEEAAEELSVSRVKVHASHSRRPSFSMAGKHRASKSHHAAGPEAHQLRIHLDSAELAQHQMESGSESVGSVSAGLTDGSVDRHPKLQQVLNQLDSYMVDEDLIAASKLEGVRQYYEDQNELVQGYKDVVGLLEGGMSDEDRAHGEAHKARELQRHEKLINRTLEWALRMSVFMILLKVFSAIWSSSIAVIASAVDSVLDLVSQGILVLAARFMKRKDAIKYPIGKSRIESLAILVFGIVMAFAAVFLLQESARVLQKGLSDRPTISFDTVTIVIMAFTIVVQIGVYVWCRRLLTIVGDSSNAGSVEALAQDQLNDVIVNTCSSVAAAVATAKSDLWFIDSIIGMVVSL
ncbi:MAG: cation transporter [Candidatus Pacebacteria bacterium]|nr:cation transporter [Candidatus Paceibacterota bacterium]